MHGCSQKSFVPLCVCVPMQVTRVSHLCAQPAVHMAAGVHPCVFMDRRAVFVCVCVHTWTASV